MRWMILALFLGLAPPGLAWAHEGEDHDEAQVPPVTAQQSQAAGATGETFEVLVKAPLHAEPGEAVALRVFVADTKTNAPIEGASVELSFLGASEVKHPVSPTGSPGIYAAAVTLPSEGDWEVMASVSRAGAVEVLALGALQVGGDTAAESMPPARGVPGLVGLATAVLVLLVTATLWGMRHRLRLRSRRRPPEVSDA